MNFIDHEPFDPRATIVLEDAEDLYAPASPTNLVLAIVINRSGLFRLARRTCALKAVEIKAGGSFGSLRAYDGNGKPVYNFPSTFTGSFPLEPCCWDGLYIHSTNGGGAPCLVTVSWREKDAEIV